MTTVGLTTVGLTTVGLTTVGLTTVGLTTVGLTTVGLAMRGWTNPRTFTIVGIPAEAAIASAGMFTAARMLRRDQQDVSARGIRPRC
jgi:hypothetical protein